MSNGIKRYDTHEIIAKKATFFFIHTKAGTLKTELSSNVHDVQWGNTIHKTVISFLQTAFCEVKKDRISGRITFQT